MSQTYTQHEDEPTGDETEARHDLRRRASGEIRDWRPQEKEEISHSTSERESNKHVPPLFVHHGRCHAVLVVRSHHHTQKQNDKSRHWVERHTLRPGRLPVFVICIRTMATEAEESVIERVTNALGFEEHAGQTTAKEHYGDGDMLHISRRPRTTPT